MATSIPAAIGVRVRAWTPSIAAQLLLLLAIHVLLWTWAGVVSRANFDTPGDMVEAYAWAQGWEWGDRKSTRLNSSHSRRSRMPSSA